MFETWVFVVVVVVFSLVCAAAVGLRAAEMTALPRSIIQDAKAISSRVSQQLLVGFPWRSIS